MSKKGIWYSLLIASILFVGIYLFKERETVPEPAVRDSPMLIAHRGANDRFNESTLTAYKIAAEDGVDALEIDLRMTADGELIVMHDETLDRTTNGTGLVSEYRLQEIKEFQTVEVFSQQVTIEEIPTLEEIFKTFWNTEHYYIETRLVNGELAMEELLIEKLNDYDLLSQELVIIQSFSQKSLEKIRELAPDVPLAMLFRKGNFHLKEAKAVNFPIIGIEASDVTMKNVNELHRQGKEVHVFFNNSETQKDEQKRVHSLNVDGYFTDDIQFTKQLINNDVE